MASLATAWGSPPCSQVSREKVLISSQGLLFPSEPVPGFRLCLYQALHRGLWSRDSCPPCSASGFEPWGEDRYFCFAITAASIATACDVPGKAICGATEQDGGRRGGWKELQGRWCAACTPRLKGVTHMGLPVGPVHVLSPGQA